MAKQPGSPYNHSGNQSIVASTEPGAPQMLVRFIRSFRNGSRVAVLARHKTRLKGALAGRALLIR